MNIKDDETVYVLPDDMDFHLISRVIHSTDKTVPLWHNRRYKEYCKVKVYAKKVTEKSSNDLDHTQLPLPVYKCSICNVNVPKSYKKEHNDSSKHKICLQIADKALERTKEHIAESDCDDKDRIPGTYFCPPCAMSVKYTDRENHEVSSDHYKSLLHDKFLNDLLFIYINKDYLDQMDLEYLYERRAIEALIIKNKIHKHNKVKCVSENKHHESYKQSKENKQEIYIQGKYNNNKPDKDFKQSEVDKQSTMNQTEDNEQLDMNKLSEDYKHTKDYTQREIDNLQEINKMCANIKLTEVIKTYEYNKPTKDYKQSEEGQQLEINKHREENNDIHNLQEINKSCINQQRINKQSEERKQAKDYTQNEIGNLQEINTLCEYIKQLQMDKTSNDNKHQEINEQSEVGRQIETNKQSEDISPAKQYIKSELDKQFDMNKQSEDYKQLEINKHSGDNITANNNKQSDLDEQLDINKHGENNEPAMDFTQSEMYNLQEVTKFFEFVKKLETNKQRELDKRQEKNIQSELEKQEKVNKQIEAKQQSQIKTVIDAKNEIIPDDNPIPLEEYINMINKKFKKEPLHKLKEENGYIVINTMDNMYVKVTPENYHAYYTTRGKTTQCRVCLVTVNGQIERHKMDEEHIKRIMVPLKTSHCLREVGHLLHHCVICNDVFANIELHENSVKHLERYDKAISFAHSKYCAKCGLYCDASEKTYNMNYRLLKGSMANFNEIIKDYTKKFIFNCEICDLCLNNYAQCVEFELHKSRLQSFTTTDSAGVQLKLKTCNKCVKKMRKICPH